ncbi:MAG TPA: peptide deformylase [Gemmatimonadaceae bacterium]|nr:peptide deformylase [Gemmatimonadaceae bacterium]
MAILDIRVLGDPVLREQTQPVPSVTDEIRQLVDDLFETMHAAGGIGLAAPQVGRRERVAVVEVDEQPLIFINPEIISRESSARDEEGCLSIPEIYGEVDRPATIVVRALDREGHPFELNAAGLLARCIQHEVDHLDGKLFIDYLSLLKRRSAARKWEDEVEKYPNFIRKIEPGQATPRKSRSRKPTPEHEPEL